jgi:hypothetical protein
MFGKKWVLGSLFTAITLITTAAAPARAEDHRWSLGRAQWQPSTHAGWFNNDRSNRDHDWRGNRDEARERNTWWRREREDRGHDRDGDRRRDHDGGWQRHHRFWD